MAILLSLANVGAHADILVFDLVGGLLTAAAAERLGGIHRSQIKSILLMKQVGERFALQLSFLMYVCIVYFTWAGYGTICSTFCSPKAPSIDMVRLFNFDDRTSRRSGLCAVVQFM